MRHKLIAASILFLALGLLAVLPMACGSDDKKPVGPWTGLFSTPTHTSTPVHTATVTATVTATPSITTTYTATCTPSYTPTYTPAYTATQTPSATSTATVTSTATASPTATVTSTATNITCPASGEFGKTTNNGAGVLSANILRLRRVQLTGNVTVDSVVVWGADDGSNHCIVEGALYSDNAGSPDALLASGGPLTAAAGVYGDPLTIVLNQTVTAGYYWFGYRGTDDYSICSVLYDSSDPTSLTYVTATDNTQPFPATCPGTGIMYRTHPALVLWHCD